MMKVETDKLCLFKTWKLRPDGTEVAIYPVRYNCKHRGTWSPGGEGQYVLAAPNQSVLWVDVDWEVCSFDLASFGFHQNPEILFCAVEDIPRITRSLIADGFI